MFIEVRRQSSQVQLELGSAVMLLWMVFYFLAAAVSVACIYLKVRAYVVLMRLRRLDFGVTSECVNIAYVTKHKKALADSEKSIGLVKSNLLVGFLEDMPLGT